MKLTGKIEVKVFSDGSFKAVLKRFYDKQVKGKKYVDLRLPSELLSEVVEHATDLGSKKRLNSFTLNAEEAYLNLTSKKVNDAYRDVLEISIVEASIDSYFDSEIKEEAPVEEAKEEVKKTSRKKKSA